MEIVDKKIQSVQVGDGQIMQLEPEIILALINRHPIFASSDGEEGYRQIFLTASILTPVCMDKPINIIQLSEKIYTKEEMQKVVEEFYLGEENDKA